VSVFVLIWRPVVVVDEDFVFAGADFFDRVGGDRVAGFEAVLEDLEGPDLRALRVEPAVEEEVQDFGRGPDDRVRVDRFVGLEVEGAGDRALQQFVAFEVERERIARPGTEGAHARVAEARQIALVDELGEGGEAEAVPVRGRFVIGLQRRPGGRREDALALAGEADAGAEHALQLARVEPLLPFVAVVGEGEAVGVGAEAVVGDDRARRGGGRKRDEGGDED
jgi:hypothetical protein